MARARLTARVPRGLYKEPEATGVFEYCNPNDRVINGLYLDTKKSDVSFVFDIDTDHPVKVPAHKIILSNNNPAFDAMFYGPVKEEGDIPIKNANVAAFKEFLQFFYLEEVRLTSENITQVMNLCKMYDMKKCTKICETVFQKSLTIDDMCFGYGFALLLEREYLVNFCELKIKENARRIMESKSFLEADRSLLEKILILVSSDWSNWSALEIVIAWIEWAKAECGRNNLEASPANLRSQLGELFDRIPFEKLTLEEFSQHKEFFNADEIVEMNQKIRLQNQLSNPFEPQSLSTPSSLGNILDCDRRDVGLARNTRNSSLLFDAVFSSNQKLLLTKFYISVEFEMRTKFKGFITDFLSAPNESRFESDGSCIVLSEPYVIEAGKEYTIYGVFDKKTEIQIPTLKHSVQLEQDITIAFRVRSFDLVSRLVFQLPEK
ncbi:BTB/POZ domain-containing protein 6-like [Sitodiplosis mosellana]|uniref:BTB/POZ domain-containing protein 6-like n=1 Tax=Sitodiplosis mosellana TaxID=263140 RepID=UPI00244446E6|nr:BTB/POZ domain-containing protein 6-like [Sitodiplosis mosellana]